MTSNNIANADTIGFKSSRAEFADVYAAGAVNLNTSPSGEGVRVDRHRAAIHAGRHHHHLLEPGPGDQRRWILHARQDPSGMVYTRNGEFTEDKNGNVVTATGQALQVYPPPAQRRLQHRRAARTSISRPRRALRSATTTGTVILNLPANSTVPTGAPFDPTNPHTYNQSTSTTVYDSLGQCVSGDLLLHADRDPGISGTST